MKVLVVGDSCIDNFIYGSATRLNPEAPSPVFVKNTHKVYKGMASNVHQNVVSLLSGGTVDLITHEESITKTRYIDETSNYTLLRVDNDVNVTRITKEQINKASDYDLVIISDYDKGFLTEEDITTISKKAKISILDTKKPLGAYTCYCDYIKINEKESNSKLHGKWINEFIITEKLIVTMGKHGARHKDGIFPTNAVPVRDVVGAGDTYLAALSVKFAETKDIVKAINFANVCASQVVSKKGISLPNIK